MTGTDDPTINCGAGEGLRWRRGGFWLSVAGGERGMSDDDRSGVVRGGQGHDWLFTVPR